VLLEAISKVSLTQFTSMLHEKQIKHFQVS